jgi:hypothetical protein
MNWRLDVVPQSWPLLERGVLTLRGHRGQLGPHFPALAPVELAPGARLVVGRAADCEVLVPFPPVNRRTAELRRDADGVRLTDLNSRNGVCVLTHARPSVERLVTTTRLEVDDAFHVCGVGFVLTPWFAVPASWRTSDGGAVWRLAQAVQMGRDWATLPVLADALEEAGCVDPDLLHHFRAVEHRLGHCAALLRLLQGLRDSGRSDRGADDP